MAHTASKNLRTWPSGTKTTTIDAKQPKIWTEREIAAMSLDQFDKYEDEIQQAMSEGRVVKQ